MDQHREIPLEAVDPGFVAALAALAGDPGELEFERRGSGDTTYCFHGRLVGVDVVAATVQILRTRSHAGAVQSMGLRYFLAVTLENGVQHVNRVAHERNARFRERQQAREDAVALASTSPGVRPPSLVLRSRYVGPGHGSLAGYAPERFIFADVSDDGRRVALIAKSQGAAEQFMAMLDIFLPLDELLWHAVEARMLWPGGIEFERQVNAQAWTFDWRQAYDELAGLPPRVLGEYFRRIRTGDFECRSMAPLVSSEVELLRSRGLLSFEASPQTFAQLLERVPIQGLRQLLSSLGSPFKSTTRAALASELARLHSPELELAAQAVMRPPFLYPIAPNGADIEAFAVAIKELRDSLDLMRMCLRATREFYREDELRLLAATA